jgi:hypothetical protein
MNLPLAPSRLPALALALGLAVLGPPTAYAGLTPGDILIVTDAGLFHHDGAVGSSATMLAPATAFGGLTSPAIEWDRGTDAAFVATGSRLLRVTITGSPPSGVAVTDVSPGVPGGFATPLYFDLDVDPVTGELYVLDRGNGVVLGFAPPFAFGMDAEKSVAITNGTRAFAVDSRTFPRTIVIPTMRV